MQNIPLLEQVFNKGKDKNIAGLPQSILWSQSTLVYCIQLININPLLPAIAFISNWMFYRQPFLRTTFQYNSKWRKIKKFNKAFDQLDQFLTNLKLKIQIHHIKIFIHSKLLLLKLQAWKCRRKCILCQFYHGSSGMHLLSILGALGQKAEVLLSIFYGSKITSERITPPPHF